MLNSIFRSQLRSCCKLWLVTDRVGFVPSSVRQLFPFGEGGGGGGDEKNSFVANSQVRRTATTTTTIETIIVIMLYT